LVAVPVFSSQARLAQLLALALARLEALSDTR
jgi:hypothetical protein